RACYTTATTMNAGWRWTIPTRESDHLGYVYASSYLSDDAAAEELAASCPGITEPKIVRFRVGRHDEIWRGNVMAIGNSYAFVEPLESSGLLMITLGILSLVNSLPASWDGPCGRDFVNAAMASRWDAIRWFLSIHYRFNTRLDTPFWKDVREHADISGMRPLLDVFASGAPLRGRDRVTRGFANSTAPTFYGLAGVDTILLGQHVPTRLLPLSEPLARWKLRKAGADLLVARAMPQRDALAAFDALPSLHEELLDDSDSWAYRHNPLSLF
ncbi:MAG: tryptophan 7-halogenase, partial [Dactylosporangium sp.]|nr:tryptophan 7-halogenase [Dactylosporangium sp.]